MKLLRIYLSKVIYIELSGFFALYNRKLIIIGAGTIARSFIEHAPKTWKISIVDRERDVIEEIQKLYPFV